MSVESTGAERPSFDLKSAQLPVLSVVLRSTDMQALAQACEQAIAYAHKALADGRKLGMSKLVAQRLQKP